MVDSVRAALPFNSYSSMRSSFRCILMLIYITSKTIRGAEGSICQGKWQTHTWEWQQMEDTFMRSQDSMAHNVEALLTATLCWIQRQKSGLNCPHYPFLGMGSLTHRDHLKLLQFCCQWHLFWKTSFFFGINNQVINPL